MVRHSGIRRDLTSFGSSSSGTSSGCLGPGPATAEVCLLRGSQPPGPCRREAQRANRSRHPAQLSSVARCGVQWPPNGPLLDFRTSVQFTANVLRAIVQSEPTCYPVYVYHRSQATDHLILRKRDNDPKHDLRCSSKFWCQI
jgi:hypothetical protein